MMSAGRSKSKNLTAGQVLVAAASASASAATGPIFARPRFVDSERSATDLAAIEFVDGFLSSVVTRHLDKTKTF
jgi:hypothetical protein